VADYPHPLNAGRSANMRANRRKDTKPELALRRALHAQGYRYRKDYRLDLARARVRPDIAFTARRVAVFVDGCFWHCCPDHGSQPANNAWYWQPKLARNVERDRAADDALAEAGWNVVRIWEHESLEAAVAVVVSALAAAVPARLRNRPGAAAASCTGELLEQDQAVEGDDHRDAGAGADRGPAPVDVGAHDPGLAGQHH
jgi:DNA mismatch endonuclease (patch repair protein)